MNAWEKMLWRMLRKLRDTALNEILQLIQAELARRAQLL